MLKEPDIDIIWTGPYSWPKFESDNQLPSLPKHPGIAPVWVLRTGNRVL